MRFGFDVDDTLINLREYAFQLYNKKLNRNVGLDVFQSINTLEIHDAFGLDAKTGGELWNSLKDEIYFSDCQIFEEAVETLQELDREGHDVFYITSRMPEHCKRTKNWLVERGFPVREGHFFCGMKDEEKINIIHQLKLDYYVDDKPAVLETLLNIPTKVIAFDSSYNQTTPVPRLKHWSEFKTLW